MKKKIPAGKKGKGIRMLKKKAPEVAAKMGYKKGGMVNSEIKKRNKLSEEMFKIAKGKK